MADVMRIEALNEQFGLPGVAQFEAGNGGLPKVRITTQVAVAEVYLYGAQVTSWTPDRFDEVLFVSEKSHWQEGKPIRGGIPVCFPWFRGKGDDKQAPTHGFVRMKEWRVDAVRGEADGALMVKLSTESDADSQHWWPHEFRLEYTITAGKSLRLELKMHNTGSTELHFQEALHTYFHVGDVRRASVRGLDGLRYLDNRDGNQEKVQHGELVLTKQTDNAYLNATGAVEIVDPVLARRLVTEKSNSVSTIVWNPWSDGAASLPDFGDQEWEGMLCAEGGNVLGQCVRLAARSSHTMVSQISVLRF